MLGSCYTCAYCGEYATQVDHVLPGSAGGHNSAENLVACCTKCNSTASNKVFLDFTDKKQCILAKRKL